MEITRQTLPAMTCNLCLDYPTCKGEKICKDFKLAQTIYCNKRNYQLDVKACMNRKSKNYLGCKSCKKGKMIFNFLKAKEATNHGETN